MENYCGKYEQISAQYERLVEVQRVHKKEVNHDRNEPHVTASWNITAKMIHGAPFSVITDFISAI